MGLDGSWSSSASFHRLICKVLPVRDVVIQARILVLSTLNLRIKGVQGRRPRIANMQSRELPRSSGRRGAGSWLNSTIHPNPDSSRHVPPYERGFGANPWNAASDQDRTLVYYLNRYCYRCHSSIKYSVFERDAC